MPTLVLASRYGRDPEVLWHAALAAGWDVERPRSFHDVMTLAGKDLAYYGDTVHADAIASACAVSLLEAPPSWLPDLSFHYRRRTVNLCTLAAARAWPRRAFIKPCGEKVFPAAVYEHGIDAHPSLDDDMAVLVAEPVTFGVEVRTFVVNRRVAALSAYVRHGEFARRSGGRWPLARHEEIAALEFVTQLLADPAVELPPGLVLDCGEILGRGWAVVEANPAWTSALCGCDPAAVLDVLHASCVPRSALTPPLARWVRGALRESALP